MLLPSHRLSDAQGSNSSEVSGFKEVLLSYTAHVQGCDDGVRQHIGEVLTPSQAAAASRERERVREREKSARAGHNDIVHITVFFFFYIYLANCIKINTYSRHKSILLFMLK